MFDGFTATASVQIPDKAVGDQAHTREHAPLLPGSPQVIEPPEPVSRAAQLYAVEAGRGCELPLLENVVARKDVLLTRQLHAPSLPVRGALLRWGYSGIQDFT